MRLARFFKLLLLIFECFIFFAALNVFHLGINQAYIQGITYMASVSLFLLMAIFIWLDSARYKVYMPLFIAGKCIGILSLIIGLVSTSDIIPADTATATGLLFFYILSIVLVILIILREKKYGGKNQSEEKNEEKKPEVV
jgi:hypothetical protein